MPLTPRSDDPNRKKELARKKKDPMSFGTFPQAGPIEQLPKDWKPSGPEGGLVTVGGKVKETPTSDSPPPPPQD